MQGTNTDGGQVAQPPHHQAPGLPRGLDKLAMHAQRQALLSSQALEKYCKDHESLGLTLATRRSFMVLSSTPIANSFRLPYFTAIWTAASVLSIALWATGFWPIRHQHRIPAYQYYRFTNLEHRDASIPPFSPGIARFGLQRRGEIASGGPGLQSQGDELLCLAPENALGTLSSDGETMTLSLPRKPEAALDAWYIVTLRANGTEGEDTVRFTLEGSDDPLFASPAVVGSSTSVRYFYESVLTHEAAPTPLERGGQLVLDTSKGTRRMFLLHMIHLPIIVAAFSAIPLAITRRTNHCKRAFVMGLRSSFFLHLVWAVATLVEDMIEGEPAVYPVYGFVLGFAFLGEALVIEWIEELWDLFISFFVTCQLCAMAYVHSALLGGRGSFLVVSHLHSSAAANIAFLPLLSLVMYVRVRLIYQRSCAAARTGAVDGRVVTPSNLARKAHRAVRPSKRVYDEAWKAVVARQKADLRSLQQLVKAMRKESSRKQARQLKRLLAEAPRRPSFRSEMGGVQYKRASSIGAFVAFSFSSHQPREDSNRGRNSIHPEAPAGSGPQTPESSHQTSPGTSLLRSRWSLFFSRSLEGMRRMSDILPNLSQDDTGAPFGYLENNVLQSKRLAKAMVACRQGAGTQLGKPVKTLDHLHAQAFLVQDIFLDFVVRLAELYRGKFKLKRGSGETPEFAAWGGSEDTMGNYQLGGIKSLRSCAVKLELAYAQDVSRLLDMVRETIFFDKVADLEKCLGDVRANPSIEVVAVKSSMRPNRQGKSGASWMSGSLSAGMRFVSVYVRFSGHKEARDLFVDTHVCELLLVLTDIAKVQTCEMREAYQEWRKCKRLMSNAERFARWAASFFGKSDKHLRFSPVNSVSSVASLERRSRRDSKASDGSFSRYSDSYDSDPKLNSEERSATHSRRQSSFKMALRRASESWAQQDENFQSEKEISSHQSNSGDSKSSRMGELSKSTSTFQAASHKPPPSPGRPKAPGPEPGPASPLSQAASRKPPIKPKPPLPSSPNTQAPSPRPRSQSPRPRSPSPKLRLSLERSESSGLMALEGKQTTGRRRSSLQPIVGGEPEGNAPGQAQRRRGRMVSTSSEIERHMTQASSSGAMSDGPQWGGKTSWSVSLSDEMHELLVGLCQVSGLGLADFIDSRWSAVVAYSDSSSFNSVFFSVRPVTSAGSRWQFLTFVTVTAMLGVFGIFQTLRVRMRLLEPYSLGPYTHYRMETKLTRSGMSGNTVDWPGVSQFGLLGLSRCSEEGSFPMEDGQPEKMAPSFSGPFGASYVLSYPEARSITGWYIKTGAGIGSEAQDPAYFNVWASNDNWVKGNASCALGRSGGESRDGRTSEWCGARWDKVGTPRWEFARMGTGPAHALLTLGKSPGESVEPWHFAQIPISLPMERGFLQTFVLPPDSELYDWLQIYPLMIATVGLLLAIASGVIADRWNGLPPVHVCLSASIGLATVCGLWGFIMSLNQGMSHIAIGIVFGRVLPSSILCAAIAFQGPWFMRGLWCHSILGILLPSAVGIWLHGLLNGLTLDLRAVSTFLIAILVSCARRWTFWRTDKLLGEDQAKYDQLWRTLMLGEDSRACIKHLEQVVRMIGLDEKNYCRQHNRMRADKLPPKLRARYLEQTARNPALNPLFFDMGRWYVVDRQDPSSLVSSFNQLYFAAAIANLLLVERVKAWAEASQGMFRAGKRTEGDRERFLRWNDVKDHEGLRAQVTFAALKRHGRAVEKLQRSYGTSPSRLLDVSRNSIIFESMVDLTNCLGTIITDENVRVERLKNRLSPSYRADETAGYRDVCINLRVVNPAAQTLGVELHMCEVQLLLLSFAHLRTSEGHKRYVWARNAKGE